MNVTLCTDHLERRQKRGTARVESGFSGETGRPSPRNSGGWELARDRGPWLLCIVPNSCSCRKCRIPARGAAPGQQGRWPFCFPLSFNDLGESHLWVLCPSDRSAGQKMPLFSGTAGLGEQGPNPPPPTPLRSPRLGSPADQLLPLCLT